MSASPVRTSSPAAARVLSVVEVARLAFKKDPSNKTLFCTNPRCKPQPAISLVLPRKLSGAEVCRRACSQEPACKSQGFEPLTMAEKSNGLAGSKADDRAPSLKRAVREQLSL